MDIKWKNINTFNAFKIVLIFLILMSVLAFIPSYYYVRDFVLSDYSSYTKTQQFEEQFNRLVHNIVEYTTVLKSEEHIQSTYGKSKTNAEHMLERLHSIEENLASSVNFIYYIENPKTKEVFTNIDDTEPVTYLRKQSAYVYYNEYRAENSSSFNYNDEILSMLKGTDYVVHAGVYRSLRIGDDFFMGNAQFSKMITYYPNAKLIMIASIFAFLLSFGILAKIMGRDIDGNLIESKLDRIYNEVQILVAYIASIFMVNITYQIVGTFLEKIYGNLFYGISIYGCIKTGINTCVVILLFFSFLRQYRSKRLFKNTITHELFTLAFKTHYFKSGLAIVIIIYVGINAILGVYLLAGISYGSPHTLISLIVFVGFNLFSLIFFQRSLRSLTQIMVTTKQISHGDFQNIVDKDGVSLTFRDFYTDIISIKDGMEEAISDAVKGERLKTELITNVSHDLKTPLTSIINYVDLLKRENVEGQKAKDYIDVIEEKSERLKHLIDDLLEASKASSGNITVELQTLDLNELVNQALGEYEDKFEKAHLDLRVNTTQDNILILGDSKHMWRIAENLLTNAIKYAMVGTRVYIDTYKESGYGVITIKNVSALPLDISPEQLTERFVRGDEARTTDGSGLGLSITESLTSIQGGKFTISIDGDLFKSTVEIPLSQETSI